jgi:hypothetical protein
MLEDPMLITRIRATVSLFISSPLGGRSRFVCKHRPVPVPVVAKDADCLVYLANEAALLLAIVVARFRLPPFSRVER